MVMHLTKFLVVMHSEFYHCFSFEACSSALHTLRFGKPARNEVNRTLILATILAGILGNF